jgi:Arc/MetJ family transcription regulator
MFIRLNITMDEALYARLKKEVRPKRLSAFINEAIRAQLIPDRQTLDRAYKAASKERWRTRLEDDWSRTETEGWPAPTAQRTLCPSHSNHLPTPGTR